MTATKKAKPVPFRRGDVVIYTVIGNMTRKVMVNEINMEGKNKMPIFSGVLMADADDGAKNGDRVWGYCSQVTKIIPKKGAPK